MMTFRSQKPYLYFLAVVSFGWLPSLYAQGLLRLDAPIGIRNEYGCCHVIQFLHLMHAVHHVIPDLFNNVLVDSPYSLLDGYVKTLSDIMLFNADQEKGFARQIHILSPDSFVQAFVMTAPDRMQKMVFEEEKMSDGTVKKKSMGPWKEAARGGTSYELMRAFFEQWNASCGERGLVNPFACSFVLPTGKTESFYWVSLDELRGATTNVDVNNVATVEFARLLPRQACVSQYPQFLIAANWEEKPIIPPFTLHLNTAGPGETGKILYYEGLAAGYTLPIFLHNEGFKGNHGITIVRYGTTFYLCDNETIMPFVNAQAAGDWVRRAGRISYSGPGIDPRSVFRVIMPRVVIYERVGSNEN
jgi:hypothetical protein